MSAPVDPGLVDAVTQSPEAVSALGASLASSGGAVGILWLLLRGKFDSIALLWKKLDALDKDTSDKVTALGKEMSDNRLADSKEYATRVELTTALGKLETHIDQRFNSLEAQIKGIKRRA